MSLALIHELWEYHHWANRRLFDVTLALGEDVAAREVGPQFSYPTLRRMFGHLYGADWFWLETWLGRPGQAVPGDEFATLAEIRPRWDALIADQRRFLAGVTEADLPRPFAGIREGRPFSRPFGMLLFHIPNHATHHRSEVATMLTMVSGSPPDTGINSYYLQRAPASG
jgi:uncharacterized damage-inducible protein DinB